MNLWGSIRKTARAEVRRLQAQNSTLRDARNPLWLRILGPLTTNRSLFRLLAGFGLVWSLLVFAGLFLTFDMPAQLAPLAEDFGRTDTVRNLLSYMLGAQATMVGLIFPLALGMVTLIVQRDEGAATNADVQLYYDQSLAYAVGTSGITLAIALVIALFGPEATVLDLAGRAAVAWSISAAVLIILGIWLLVNMLVTWQFLILSLSFINPKYRAAARRRFVSARVIPRHLAGLLSQHCYLKIDETLSSRGNAPMPFIMAGAAEGGRGEREIMTHFRQQRELIDVRLLPLRLGVRLWAWRCRRAKLEISTNKYDWMLGFAGPLDRRLRGDALLCRRQGGVELNAIERWLIRAALVFGAPTDEDALGPSDILEELADRVLVQMDRMALTGFDHALREMREFHRFLLTAYTMIDEQGVAMSYAAYGLMSAEHSNWVREYRRLFERAVANIEREDSFIGSLAFLPGNLVPDPKDNVPPWIVGGLFEFPQYLVHRIGHWLTGQRLPRGRGLASLTPGALPPQVAKAYRSVALRIVGATESALHAGARYAAVPDGANAAVTWNGLVRSWPILFKHIESVAYLIIASHWHEDEIGAALYIDSLLRWRETLGDIAEPDFEHVLWSDFLPTELLDLPWVDVEARVGPLLRYAGQRDVMPGAVYAAMIANLHADIRVVAALLLAGWIDVPGRIHGVGPAAKRLARATAPRRGSSVVDLVRTFVRLRIAEWSTEKSGYIGGLDDLVRALDGMIEGERVPGRVYTVETRFRVGSLSGDWFVLVAAIGDVEAFSAIETWVAALGDDEASMRVADETLWQLQNWLLRTASSWAEPASKLRLSGAIHSLDPVLSADAAGDRLHAALVKGAEAIEAHRKRRLAAMPIAEDKLTELALTAAEALPTLISRIGLFPAATLQVVRTAIGPVILKWTGVDKRVLVSAPIKNDDATFPERFAATLIEHAAGEVWKPFFKLRRRRMVVKSVRHLFETAAVEGAKILANGARPILLLPTQNGDWPDLYEAQEEFGDAVALRNGKGLARTYLYTYAGVDFHRSRVAQAELFSDDLLTEITIGAPDPQGPVNVASKRETDPTKVSLNARLAVSAAWRDVEIIVLVRRARRAA